MTVNQWQIQERGLGGPGPLILAQNRGQKGRKKFFLQSAPPSPPPSRSQGLDLALLLADYKQNILLLSVFYQGNYLLNFSILLIYGRRRCCWKVKNKVVIILHVIVQCTVYLKKISNLNLLFLRIFSFNQFQYQYCL